MNVIQTNIADSICEIVNRILTKHKSCTTYDDLLKYQHEDGMKMFYVVEAARLWNIERNTFKLNSEVEINHKAYIQYIIERIPTISGNIEMVENIKNIIVTLIDKKQYMINTERKYRQNIGMFINSLIVPRLYDD